MCILQVCFSGEVSVCAKNGWETSICSTQIWRWTSHWLQSTPHFWKSSTL